ncbi:MAG: prolipoprotein diacylglyceryl transferase [Cyclobacteriaceae bacterium]
MLDFIVWDPTKEIFRIPGLDHPIAWYGLLFAMAFVLSQQVIFYIWKAEGKTAKDVEALTLYIVIATVVGARLGHCLFYDPVFYLNNPLEILMPWKGGLASHGAAIGILTGIYLYARKRADQSYLWVVDRLVIVVALSGCLIRFGNFINSEIVGKPTGTDYGVVFARAVEENLEAHEQVEDAEAAQLQEASKANGLDAPVMVKLRFSDAVDEQNAPVIIDQLKNVLVNLSTGDEPDIKLNLDQELVYEITPAPGNRLGAELIVPGIPRHPAQLYESISSLILFVGLFFLWYRKKGKTPPGLIFGIFLILLFGLRFLYEFLKENQEAFEDDLPLNMGQWLSIPLVVAGVVILTRTWLNRNKTQGTGS